MDSELVVKQLRGKYRVRAKGLQDVYMRVKELEAGFENVEYHHLSRENERMKAVDALANRAIDAVLSGGVLS
jgi:ribonuclease HI